MLLPVCFPLTGSKAIGITCISQLSSIPCAMYPLKHRIVLSDHPSVETLTHLIL